MPAKKLNKKNCCFLYGEDLVSLALRREGLLKAYFEGNPPDPVLFDGEGSLEEYENALAGQSLFSSATAVVMHNPPFLKRISKAEKEEKAALHFVEVLQGLPPDIFCLIQLDGKPDKRTKIVKGLLSVCYSEELSLLLPRDAAGAMIRLLSAAGKRVDFSARTYLEDVLSSWDTISLPLLQTECDKMVLMCGEKSVVTKELLELALPDYMNQGIFKFVDALLDKKSQLVLESADRVFTDMTTTIKNLGLLSSKFRKIKILKEMERNRVPPTRIQQALGVRSSWQWRAVQAEARKVTEEEAEWFLLEIMKYQLASRQGASELELKDLLLKYCLRK